MSDRLKSPNEAVTAVTVGAAEVVKLMVASLSQATSVYLFKYLNFVAIQKIKNKNKNHPPLFCRRSWHSRQPSCLAGPVPGLQPLQSPPRLRSPGPLCLSTAPSTPPLLPPHRATVHTTTAGRQAAAPSPVSFCLLQFKLSQVQLSLYFCRIRLKNKLTG